MMYFITGGERSGKSTYAQKLALELSNEPVYVATSRVWDKDFEKRIERHKNDRNKRWKTIEEEKYFSKIDVKNKVVVIDCVTLWITNFWIDTKYNIQESLKQIKKEINALETIDCTFIIISNEIGMGIHANTEKGRKFVELHGWINQYIAAKANTVVFMVSGIPIRIKPVNPLTR